MTMTLIALLFAASLVSVIATLFYTWRESGLSVVALSQQMRGSQSIGHMHYVVRVPVAHEHVTPHAMAIRLPDPALVAG